MANEPTGCTADYCEYYNTALPGNCGFNEPGWKDNCLTKLRHELDEAMRKLAQVKSENRFLRTVLEHIRTGIKFYEALKKGEGE